MSNTVREKTRRAWNQLCSYASETYRTITIEPNVFLHIFTIGIVIGAAVHTNVVLWKICAIVKGYDEELCTDMVYEGGNHSEVKKEVQAYLNDFELYMDFIKAGPAIIYSLFAGALSDRYGSRRPLMLAPMIGWTVSFLVHIIHYYYIYEAPLWLFYAYSLRWVMGGQALYYQGSYLYVSDITTPEEKTTRFARMDGVVILAYMLGLFASPYIYDLGGYYLACGLSLAMNVAAIIHMLFFVKDFKVMDQSKQESTEDDLNDRSCFTRYFVTPAKESFETIVRKRPKNFRTLLYILLATYATYFGNYNYNSQIYLYLTLVFEGFDGKAFAALNVYAEIVNTFALLVLVPIIKARLKWHETTMTVVFSASYAVGALACAASTNLWPEWYLSSFFPSMNTWMYSCLRALFTQVVSPQETGKVFSAIAILVAIVPAAFGPLYKKTYNATIAINFPSAFLLLAAAIYTLICSLCIILWFNRNKMKTPVKDEGKGDQLEAEGLCMKDTSQNNQDSSLHNA